ncbi:unnamed protein product [Heterobilharzia americana]|nr:unnamed protein product [Heterobilharzia americana]
MIVEFSSLGSSKCELTNGWKFLMNELNISYAEARNLDAEGRVLALKFSADIFKPIRTNYEVLPLVVLCVYFPRLNSEDVKRLKFKHLFQRTVQLCTEFFLIENNVVIAGDFNICHKAIDHCAPEEIAVLALFYATYINQMDSVSTSFRQWFDQLLIGKQRDQGLGTDESLGLGRFVDIFRLLHPDQENAFTCWSLRTNARQTNYGVRLDYILLDSQLVDLITSSNEALQADLMPNISGSDHCPVYADLPYFYNTNLDFFHFFPLKCSHYWPQCQTKQIQLNNFLVPKRLSTVSEQASLPNTSVDICCLESLDVKSKNSNLKQAKITFGGFIATKMTCKDVQLSSIGESTITLGRKDTDLSRAAQSSEAWRNLLSGPKKPPLCLLHKEPCVMRTVKQVRTTKGNRYGRRFWVCARPQGASDNPAAQCNTFFWDDQVPKNSNKSLR